MQNTLLTNNPKRAPMTQIKKRNTTYETFNKQKIKLINSLVS